MRAAALHGNISPFLFYLQLMLNLCFSNNIYLASHHFRPSWDPFRASAFIDSFSKEIMMRVRSGSSIGTSIDFRSQSIPHAS